MRLADWQRALSYLRLFLNQYCHSIPSAAKMINAVAINTGMLLVPTRHIIIMAAITTTELMTSAT
jgi:hypothetical protein